jgi:hypothetical protein
MEEHNSKMAYGNCKLWMPPKKAQGKGAYALGLYVGPGPFWLQVTAPTKHGEVAKFRATWWTGRLTFADLFLLFPEQTGCTARANVKARQKNSYSKSQKAVIRNHTLRMLWLMLARPKQFRKLDPALKPRVAAELGFSTANQSA